MTSRQSESGSKRDSKTAELLKQVDDGLEDLHCQLAAGKSETLVVFLETMSRFHRYSFRNVLLIMQQKPEASRVAGFNAWKKLNRSVRKGEKGIRILAPVVRRRKHDEKGTESEPAPSDEESDVERTRKLVGYRVVHVFDLSQTDGEPLPGLDRVAGNPGSYIDRLRSLVSQLGIALTTEELGSADGVSRGGAIALQAGLDDAEACSVLIHELSHEILHQKTPPKERPNKTIRETEAEAVAFVVSKAIGLENGTAASDYIQLYQGTTETLQSSLQRVRSCAAQILSGIQAESATPVSDQ